jgi:hypothetical protein
VQRPPNQDQGGQDEHQQPDEKEFGEDKFVHDAREEGEGQEEYADPQHPTAHGKDVAKVLRRVVARSL